MSGELFQHSDDRGDGIGRRARVLPFSIAAHVAAIGAAVLVPALVVGALPDPRASLGYVSRDILLPAAPAPPPAGTERSSRRATGAAPTEAPARLPDPGTEAIDASETGLADTDLGVLHGEGGVPAGFGVVPVDLPPPPPAPPRIVRVGGEIQPPVKIRDVAPVYPSLARAAGVQGIVIIEAVIDVTGHVAETRLLRSVPLLDQAALTAVRQWVFTPTRLNGQPTSVVMTVTVQFRLN